MKLRRQGEPDREICGRRAASCICRLDPGHDGDHTCTVGCGGSWTVDDEGDFHAVTLPLGMPDFDSVNDLFILADGERVPPDDDNSLERMLRSIARRSLKYTSTDIPTTEGSA